MTRNRTLHRLVLVALTAAAFSLTIAQSAQADGGWRRWKRVDHGRNGRVVQRVVYRDASHDGAGPVLAGLIGGFVLGAAMTHPHAVVVRERECAPPPPRFRYEEVSGDRWWDTLDECREAAYGRYGPRVIKVVDARSGRCVDTLYWKYDHFISDGDREYDRGWNNRDDN